VNLPMALSLNKPKLDNLANEIWKSAERNKERDAPAALQKSSSHFALIRARCYCFPQEARIYSRTL
jgi:hypothetical protein